MSKIKTPNLTKKEISKKIHTQVGFSLQYIEEITNDIIKVLMVNIKKKQINIKNFGKFKVIFKKERIGRNPKNNRIHKISARNSLSFIPTKKLNGNNQE